PVLASSGSSTGVEASQRSTMLVARSVWYTGSARSTWANSTRTFSGCRAGGGAGNASSCASCAPAATHRAPAAASSRRAVRTAVGRVLRDIAASVGRTVRPRAESGRHRRGRGGPGCRGGHLALESTVSRRRVPMSLRLFNSLTRRIEPFEPLDPACPTMYLCGPTVYNYVHIGNARGPVVFGVLAALLRRRHGALRYARNITDVDDKINAAAREAGVPISVITDRYAAAYREDMAALGVSGPFAPDIEPAATAHIGQMVAMIERLVASGHAYVAEGHVLFAVDTFPGYGRLSRRDPE